MYAVNPGLCYTKLPRNMAWYKSYISSAVIYPFLFIIMKSPLLGIQTILRCVLDPELEDHSGKYYEYVLLELYCITAFNFVFVCVCVQVSMPVCGCVCLHFKKLLGSKPKQIDRHTDKYKYLHTHTHTHTMIIYS